jgi:VIT1/CCC1 family predicted Fe2+/Mn2+ transporter
VQAAISSAGSFTVGGGLPLLAAIAAPSAARSWVVAIAALVSLALLGAFGAEIGGASKTRPALRTTLLGALAMGVSAAIGAAVGSVVT